MSERVKFKLTSEITIASDILEKFPGMEDELRTAVRVAINQVSAKMKQILDDNRRLFQIDPPGHVLSHVAPKIERLPTRSMVAAAQQGLEETAEELK